MILLQFLTLFLYINEYTMLNYHFMLINNNAFTRIFIILIFTGFISQYTNAQNPQRTPDVSGTPKVGLIKGTILDSTTNGTIEYATVGLYRQRDSSLVNGLVTDVSGVFTFKELPYGRYYVEANFIGYKKKRIPDLTITPQKTSINLGNILLHQVITQIGDVTIVAQSQRVEYKIDKKVVNVSQDISAAGGTLVNVLENTPSIQVDVEGNVTLRGSENFQVLIDGKPSVIQGSEGLQQIPASAVNSVEIITSPSAKYDPDGAAGIINVIMKKQKNSGIGGIINASIGTRDKYSTDFLMNLRHNKINFYLGAEYDKRSYLNTGESEKRTYYGDTTTYILTNMDGKFTRTRINFKSGLDYYINEKSTLSLSGDIATRKFSRDFLSKNNWYTAPVSVDSFFIEDNNSSEDRKYYNLNVDYHKKFDENGHNIQASFYYAKGDENEAEDYIERATNNYYEIKGLEPERSRSRMKNPETNLRFELDYTRPTSAGKIEMGLQSRWDIDEGNYIYEDYQPIGEKWIHNDSISNSLNYIDALQSAYGTYSGPLGKFDFQIGLRAEYDNRSLTQKTSSESFTYEKMHFFPSFYLIRKLSESNQFQFTYTRRIQRPNEWSLNPFKEYRGSNMISFGNPRLKPEFTNSFELNYQYMFKKGFVSLETYYRRTLDKITRISGNDTIAGEQIFFSTVTNADKDYSLGIELMTDLKLTDWWQLNLTGNLYHYQLDGVVDGEQVTSTSTTWRTNFSTSFKLKWDTRFQLMGFYNGPSNTLQGKREGFFVISAAIRKDLLKRQLGISVSVRDIFSTGVFSFTSEGSNFYTYNKFRRESPVVTLNLSYRINNYRQTNRRSSEDRDNNDTNGFDLEM
jgi:outer membrane receptor protein involved in Fe transport